MESDAIDAWLAKHVPSDSAQLLGSSDPKPVEPDWIDSWLTEQLQDDPTDVSPDSPTVARTAVQFLEQFEPSMELLKELTGVEYVSLRPDDGSDDGDPRLRPWRLRHALQGLHHGVLVVPWFRAARLVHGARLHGVKVAILPVGVGSRDVPDAVELGSLGLPEPLLVELLERGVTTVGDLRAMTKDELAELDFPSTILTGVRRLRGSADPADSSALRCHPHQFTLDPFALLDTATADSLRDAAEAELKRRIEARLAAPTRDGATDRETDGWLASELASLERRRVRAELAVRTDEVLELLHRY